jgi:hypothetical protein
MRKALVYSRRLKEAGLTQEQAEVHLGILEEIVEDEMATKSDILAMDSKFTAKFEQMEYKLTFRLGLMLTAAVGFLATFIKLT